MQQSTAKRWLKELIYGDEARQNSAIAMLPDDPGVLVRLVYENNYSTAKSGGQDTTTHVALDAVVVEAIKFILEKSHFVDLVMITKTLQSQEMRKLPIDIAGNLSRQSKSNSLWEWQACAKAVSGYWDKALAEHSAHHLVMTPTREAQIKTIDAERREFEQKFLAGKFTPEEMIEFGEDVRQAAAKKYACPEQVTAFMDHFIDLPAREQAPLIAQIRYPTPKLHQHKGDFCAMLDEVAKTIRPRLVVKRAKGIYEFKMFSLTKHAAESEPAQHCCVTLAQLRRASSRGRS